MNRQEKQILSNFKSLVEHLNNYLLGMDQELGIWMNLYRQLLDNMDMIKQMTYFYSANIYDLETKWLFPILKAKSLNL